ncbi:MAG: hypothetical protein EBZ61_09890 [Micrococcales bacterium]|nr:hypothetical protein [Micrococcales bacterium]
MIKNLKNLLRFIFKTQKKTKSLECYCKEQPWAPSCRVYDN